MASVLLECIDCNSKVFFLKEVKVAGSWSGYWHCASCGCYVNDTYKFEDKPILKGKYGNVPIKNVPVSYLKWALRSEFMKSEHSFIEEYLSTGKRK